MQKQYIIEVELMDPASQIVYLLRYLTLNQFSQSLYPKIYITVMQQLFSKKRAIEMFGSKREEILDF